MDPSTLHLLHNIVAQAFSLFSVIKSVENRLTADDSKNSFPAILALRAQLQQLENQMESILNDSRTSAAPARRAIDVLVTMVARGILNITEALQAIGQMATMVTTLDDVVSASAGRGPVGPARELNELERYETEIQLRMEHWLNISLGPPVQPQELNPHLPIESIPEQSSTNEIDPDSTFNDDSEIIDEDEYLPEHDEFYDGEDFETNAE